MPSAYSVPMASDVLPEPDTPTTATIRHSGTSTSTSRRLLWRAPRTPMTVGRVRGTETGLSGIPGNLTPACQRVLCRAAGRRVSVVHRSAVPAVQPPRLHDLERRG